jgi:hypothetical protein
MQIYLSFILAAVLLISGCGASGEKPATQANTASNDPAQPAVSYNTAPSTPTEAFKSYNYAKRNKDAESVKKLLSKGSLKFSETTAAQRNESLDTVVLAGNTFIEVPPIRNEKITGDTATIEIQNPLNGGWEEWPLVKEDGVWKNALDVLQERLIKRLTDAMKAPPSANSRSDNPAKK